MKFSKILKTCAGNIRGKPFIAFWNITNRCNLRCKFCSVWKSSLEELDTKKAKLAISRMNSMGITLVNIDGGEPLVRKDLEELAETCKSYGMVVGLSTNGTLVTKERAERLVNSFNEITVSIDGFGKTHDHIRGKGVYEKAVKGLKMLVETSRKNGKYMIGTNTVITKYNVSEVVELAEEMKKIGTDFFIAVPVSDPYPFDVKNPQIGRVLYPKKKDYEKVVCELLKMKRKDRNFIIPSEIFIKLINKHFSSNVKICDVGKFSMFLDSSGNVCACPRFRKPLFSIFGSSYKLQSRELEKIKNICPGCLMGCTTEVSIRCRFPNSFLELLKNAPVMMKVVNV